MKIKDMIATVVEAPIVGAGLQMIGNVGSSMQGLAGPTQTFVSLGFLGNTIKRAGFKFK